MSKGLDGLCALGLLASGPMLGCGDTQKNGGESNVAGSATAGTAGATGGAGSGGANPGGAGSGGAGTGGSVTAGAGAGGSAGSAGSAGSSGAGSSSGGSAGAAGGDGACPIQISSSTISPEIETVGIVEWSTSVSGATSARIQFGLDTNYGMEAPVEALAASNRTLLLGMKERQTYHYRIGVSSPAGDCWDGDRTIETGSLVTGLPNIMVDTRNAAALYGGFLITGQYVRGATGAPAYILDADGDFVWAYSIDSDVTGARPSYDGKYMWINAANVPETQGATVHRVSMDGLMDEDLSDAFEGQNHQMTVLPDETVAFYAYSESNCDDVKEYDPSTGNVKLVVNSQDAHGASAPCHLNAIEYSPPTDTEPDGSYVFSDLENDNITKVSRSGEVIWVLGGETNQFTLDDTTWTNQHGIDVLADDRILFFNNGAENDDASTIIEMLLDLGAETAERAWEYSDPTLKNPIMGDVQRLENGNTIVAYSTVGVLQEVSPSMEVLEELTWALGGAFGYVQKRKTLYGPPPR